MNRNRAVGVELLHLSLRVRQQREGGVGETRHAKARLSWLKEPPGEGEEAWYRDEVVLGKVRTHEEDIGLRPSSLHAAGKIDRGEQQHAVLPRVHVHLPPLLSHLVP